MAKKSIRRGGSKHKKKKIKFSILGNNCAGLKKKMDSLNVLIDEFKQPSCITIQETKLPKNYEIKLDGYQVFLKNRIGLGGGLMTAVDLNLNPFEISAKNEIGEILTVQADVNKKKIRIINCHGPQNDEDCHIKLNFWVGLEEEILNAKKDNCLILIQMDANAKIG